MSHIHLTFLIYAHWSDTSFSFLTGQVSLPCNILFHTQLLYNLPLISNDTSLLLSHSANCLTLFQPIRILATTAAWALPSTLKQQNLSTNSSFALASTSTPVRPASTNKWLHHFRHATFYTTTLLVYPILTASTLYWITTNTSTTDPHGHLKPSASPCNVPLSTLVFIHTIVKTA